MATERGMRSISETCSLHTVSGGALRGSVRELASNYHVPISNTAAATVLLENRETLLA